MFFKTTILSCLGKCFHDLYVFHLVGNGHEKTRTFKRVHDENECACITFGGTINIFTYTVLVRFVYGKIIYIHIDIYLYYI